MEDVALAERLLARWQAGEKKSALEREVWGDGSSHGRHFDRFVRTHLGVGTNRPSRQSDTIQELRRQVRSLGAIPADGPAEPWEVQLQHARESCMSALRVWNDPVARFRTGGFSLLFVAAWNGVALAKLLRSGEEWRQLDGKGAPVVKHGAEQSLDTLQLVSAALPAVDRHSQARLENVRFWIDIRNCAAHRHVPGLDLPVIPQAQAGLMNLEEVLVEEFGQEFALAEALNVPLQLTGFRDPSVVSSRRAMQAALPLDVQAALDRFLELDPDVALDPAFQLRVAFVPVVPSSARGADAVAYFVKPGQVPEELEQSLDRYVVVPKPMGLGPWFRATEVAAEVQRRTGMKFNATPHHSTAAVRLGARPPTAEEQRTLDITLAEYVSEFKQYRYTQKWVDHLVARCATPEDFRAATGRDRAPAPVQLQADQDA